MCRYFALITFSTLVLAGIANGQSRYNDVAAVRLTVQRVSEASAHSQHQLASTNADLTEMVGESAIACECCDCGLLRNPFAECIWTRDRLLGDLFGSQPRLAQHGLNLDVEVTQFYQVAASMAS